MQKYVLCVAIDDNDNFIGLTKNRGLDFLIGKKTCPGGKVEDNENLYVAAQRELKEEAGIIIPEKEWIFAGCKTDNKRFELYIMVSKSSKVQYAYTKETEEVWIGNIYEHLDEAEHNPNMYVPDFKEFMNIALEHINVKVKK